MRITHVRDLLAAGLSTATISELLPCLDTGGPHVAVPDCPEVLVDLHRERNRLTAAIEELESARRTLDMVIATAPPSTARDAEPLLVAAHP